VTILANRKIHPALSALIGLIGILLLFYCAVSRHIELPGLYMDAVNPDYLVVDLLNRKTQPAQMWYLPGNLMAGRVPLLTSLYHGTQNLWLALPFVALLGPTIGALRTAQALSGAAILVAMYFLLGSGRRGGLHWLMWLPVAALALDPVFVYAFRTQFYIQLGAVGWLLASILAGERAFSTDVSRRPVDRPYRPMWLVLAGLCYGLSIFGYFIFLFFAPALALAIFLACRRLGDGPKATLIFRVTSWLSLGFLIGMSGYIAGYYLILSDQNGISGFLNFFSQYRQQLGAFETHRSSIQTIGYFADLIWRVFSNDWQHALMFNDAWPEPGSWLKVFALTCFPFLLWIWCEIRRSSSWRLRLVMGLIVCFPVVAMLFGDRLSGHHFVVLVPLAYLALGLGLAELGKMSFPRLPINIAANAIWIVLVGINLIGLQATDNELVETHGRGLFSDSINHFASDASAQEWQRTDAIVYYFPDWGLFMPFHYLTGGKVRHWTGLDFDAMHSSLCRGQSIAIALVTGDIAVRFEDATAKLAWRSPVLLPYRDHEGNEVFTVGRFDASARGSEQDESCARAAHHD
jgi:hypothetical protein